MVLHPTAACTLCDFADILQQHSADITGVVVSCRKWLMPKERLLQCQQEDRAKGLSEHHLQQLKVYFTQCM
jgi:hypothetical protein